MLPAFRNYHLFHQLRQTTLPSIQSRIGKDKRNAESRRATCRNGVRRLMSIKRHDKEDDAGKAWNQPQLQKKLYDYLTAHSRVPDIVRQLKEETSTLKGHKMSTLIDQLPVMSMLTRMVQAKSIVDLGTFTGISALLFALAVPDDGQVITVDKSDKHLPLAMKYWEKAGVQDKIKFRQGDACDFLDALVQEGYEQEIDLAFVDANKLGYDALYERLLKLVRRKGIIILDNVLWYAQVADEESRDKITNSFRALNKKLLFDERIDFTLIPSADGLAICEIR